MSAALQASVLDDFFAPVQSDLVDELIGQYRVARERIERIADLFAGADAASALPYFIDGNCREDRSRPDTGKLFQRDGALAALNADFWQRAISMTDVLEAMPQARRDEWHKAIREHVTPEFTEESVRATIGELLISRAKFFAERVDGIFRALSNEHVTNRPEGFSKRMILAYVTDDAWSATSRAGYIHDLRIVIAKFMGRDAPTTHAHTSHVIRDARVSHRGEWIPLDGGALRIRCYHCGTAHVEVHPDMAWRLNCVLHQLHPNAIPSQFRTAPKRKTKDVHLIKRPLPFSVIELLMSMEKERTEYYTDRFSPPRKGVTSNPNALRFRYGYGEDEDKHVKAEAERVLEYLGGVKMRRKHHEWWEWDYNPSDAIEEIIATGCIPDQRAHQFYPTPRALAERVADLADIKHARSILEPSAGQGAIAAFLPMKLTTCVEVSAVHCKVLRSKGFNTIEADFLTWDAAGNLFDRVVMNPPFDQGRWQAHLERASALTTTHSGRLVAILPSSAMRIDVLPGWKTEWHGPFENEFAGTSISVAILVATRGAA